jgi:hypothetical protein
MMSWLMLIVLNAIDKLLHDARAKEKVNSFQNELIGRKK